ncbi:MAG: DUF4250 domain-containing protein [Eubacteriales bacterium]|nr:DUF4250 domain-containing protein [Eubacteriales bacterium]
MIPNDPIMLLSYVNTQLRDFYPDLESLCRDKDLDREELCRKLAAADYEYDKKTNQFI